MKKLLTVLWAAGLLAASSVFVPATALAGTDQLPALDFTLPVPESAEERKYLGLEKEAPFVLGNIRADMVIVQIFSMYCPICQREAADVNSMYDLVQADPRLKSRIRFIGIGAGNSDFEVAFYKENYQVAFPLFSDRDYAIHKQINEVGTPHFFGLKMTGNQSFEIIYSQSGEIDDPESFLKSLIRKAGME